MSWISPGGTGRWLRRSRSVWRGWMAGTSGASAAVSAPRVPPVTRTVARWAELSGSGKRWITACSRWWASATARCPNAAPQLISRSRPVRVGGRELPAAVGVQLDYTLDYTLDYALDHALDHA